MSPKKKEKDLNSRKKEDGAIEIQVDLGVYPLDAVYGASYVFIDKAYLFLDDYSGSGSKKRIKVFLKGKKKLGQKELTVLKGEFLNELLNYTLRIKLAKYNKKIREYIVEQALFSTVGVEANKIKEQEESVIGYEDDPLGIAVPWEEKYTDEGKQR